MIPARVGILPPGEVTTSQLNSAVATTAVNPDAVAALKRV